MRLMASVSTGLVLAAALCGSGLGQQYGPNVPPPPPPPGYVPAAPNLQQQLQQLTDQPATHTGFTFDKNMLQVAEGVLEANGMDERRAALALKGVSIDSYHYQQPAFYTPEAMASLLDGYHAAGWKHLVNANQTPANSAQPTKTLTDMWLHFSGTDIDGVTVLSRGPRLMNVVQLSCDLRPLDLMHLGGHFGIPKVDPDAVMVPAPR